jgi:hypothetical protein
METKRRRRYSLTAAIVCIAIAAASALSVWYHLPFKINRTVKLYSMENPGSDKIKMLDMDLTVKRGFFSPVRISGRLQFDSSDDEVYVPWVYEEIGFFRKLQKKINGTVESPAWCNAANLGEGKDVGKLLDDLVYIQYMIFGDKYAVEEIILMKTGEPDGDLMWSSDGETWS